MVATLIRCVFVAAMLVGAVVAFAQPYPAGGSAERARQELSAQNPSAALTALDADARERGGAADFTQLFLRGAAWQELARSTGDAGERSKAQAQAQQAYEEALKLNPQSAALFTNLALLATAQGDAASARQWYQKAADGPDARGGLYALNYARFLDTQGEIGPAIDYATKALRVAPGSSAARSTLASLYMRAPSDERLVPFLTNALLRGDTLFAMSTALDALQPAAARAAPQRKPLLLVAVAALARDPATLASGPDEATLRKIKVLGEDADIGPAARQLQQVLGSLPDGHVGLTEWRSSSPSLPAKTPLTPRSEMRSLLLGLAKAQARDVTRAERWIAVAVEMGERGPDPDAFLQLVELYVNSGHQERLKPLMDRYQWELFTEKGDAYGRGDWPLIFRMHLALGMTYAQMGQWKSTATPYQNAIFQLEHARTAAERANNGAAPPLALPPAAARKLAEGYIAIGEPKKAALIKLDTAEQLQKAGRRVESVDVLKTIRADEAQAFDPGAKQRYQRAGGRPG